MFSFLKNLLIGIALLVTLGLGYYLYIYQPSLEDDSNAGIREDVSLKAARFLAQLNELKEIELNSDILSDERFSSLQTYTTAVQAEKVGRSNPFLRE